MKLYTLALTLLIITTACDSLGQVAYADAPSVDYVEEVVPVDTMSYYNLNLDFQLSSLADSDDGFSIERSQTNAIIADMYQDLHDKYLMKSQPYRLNIITTQLDSNNLATITSDSSQLLLRTGIY